MPAGYVTTPASLAKALGSRRADRWVGQFCAEADPSKLPVHRVVLSSGKLKPRSAPELLEREGIPVQEDRVDLAQFHWEDFETSQPLAALLDQQHELRQQIDLTPLQEEPTWIGGVDVSYPDPNTAVAAYTLCHWPQPEIVWSQTKRLSIGFPYITSFLSYRELPVYLELLEAVWQLGRGCDVLLVDGSGILHPRRMGVATHLGVWTGIATIGVTKTYLVGDVELEGIGDAENRPVLLEGQTAGYAFRPSRSKRPLFVSPGHRVEVRQSIQWVRGLVAGHRLPEPLYWADRLSREASSHSG